MPSSASVIVAAWPTVFVSPVGPVTLDVGQSQTFTAAPTGGSGAINYQWYLDGSTPVGTDSSTYSFNESVGSYFITCKVTDSASNAVTSPASNAASVIVNSALAVPIVTSTFDLVDQGQTINLTSSPVTTGTSPYAYQWLEWAPNGTYATVGSNSASFSFVSSRTTTTGNWSFILQITDNAGAVVNSEAVSVTVNPAPTISASASSGGSISPSGSISINYGSSQTFTITANTGYYIVNVDVNGSSVGAVNSYTFDNVQNAYTISATFAPKPTPSPSPTATPTPTPSPSSTIAPTSAINTTPNPTAAPTSSDASASKATPSPTDPSNATPIPSEASTIVPTQTQPQSLQQNTIHGIAAAAAIVAIAGALFVIKKPRKPTVKKPDAKKELAQEEKVQAKEEAPLVEEKISAKKTAKARKNVKKTASSKRVPAKEIVAKKRVTKPGAKSKTSNKVKRDENFE